MERKKKNPDLLHGSIIDKLLLIAIPLACTSLLQQLFTACDVAVVGRFAGSEALAAVGANNALINMLINMFVGLSVGTNAVIARHLGQNNKARASEAAHTAILISIASGILLSIIGLLFTRPILLLISTPESLLPLAALYLKIYFSGMPFIMLYNFTAALFRSKGDTRTPLMALAFAGVINVLLNLFFVIVLHLSVAGVGLATVIANVISSLILLFLLTKEDGPLRIEREKLALSVRELKAICAIGIPAGFQATLYSFSNVIIQSSLNALGTTVIAANAAELNYEYLVYFIISAAGATNVTFVGQNFGAGQLRRCRRGTRLGLILSTSATAGLGWLVYLTGPLILKVFTDDPAVIALGLIRLQLVVLGMPLNTIIESLSGALRGMGHALAPAVICVGGICFFRVFYVFFLYPSEQTYAHLLLVYRYSWLVTLFPMILLYLTTVGKLRRSMPEQ